jgi:1-phosphofructokinase family hexose kinase
MIYTLTLNPAVDRELTVAEMRFDSVLRASELRIDFGGKGFNVSRLLREMGTASTAMGFVGGYAGQFLQDGLQRLGIETDFVWIAEETRTNVSIVTPAHEHYMKVNEKGPRVDASRQDELLGKVQSLARPGDWWVLAGSLPPGVEEDYYARIIRSVIFRGGQVLLDASGKALRLGCMEGPHLVKPNVDEARAITGLPVSTVTEIAVAARRIRAMGAQNVVVSMGKLGALLASSEGTWLAHSPEIEEKNPIGAGDAMVGGLVWALCNGLLLREALKWGVASGTATASLNGTAMGSRRLIEGFVSQVRCEELN